MRVAIIHPWFPQYREPFFRQLISDGSAVGIDFEIFHGDPPPEWNERGDSVSASYATRLSTQFISIAGKSVVRKNLTEFTGRTPYDLVILEHAVRNLETYKILTSRRIGAVAFWGHGRTYTQPAGRLQEYFKNWLLRRSDWFFSYTRGGKDAVVKGGFSPEKVTVLNNSVDTSALMSAQASVTETQISDLKTRLSLGHHNAVYVGGLDSSKRIDFLLEAGESISKVLPDFVLIVVGAGDHRAMVEEAASRFDWLKYEGPLFGKQKAVVLAVADIMLIPGRVGLVAVDSFASGVPIVTTRWPWHAPEFEYLEHGVNGWISEDTLASYVADVVELWGDQPRLTALADAAQSDAARYTIEKMAANFVEGVLAWNESRVDRSSRD